jgi:hypothetical protein
VDAVELLEDEAPFIAQNSTRCESYATIAPSPTPLKARYDRPINKKGVMFCRPLGRILS